MMLEVVKVVEKGDDEGRLPSIWLALSKLFALVVVVVYWAIQATTTGPTDLWIIVGDAARARLREGYEPLLERTTEIRQFLLAGWLAACL